MNSFHYRQLFAILTSVMGYFYRFCSILLIYNILFSLYSPSFGYSSSSHVVNNQRSADRDYKYAWFTRDIHDTDDEPSNEEQHNIGSIMEPSARRLLNRAFYRKYMTK